MKRVIVIPKKQLFGFVALSVLVVAAVIAFSHQDKTVLMDGATTKEPRVIHMVAGEFSSTAEDGKEIEAYRWDPGTVVMYEGELVKLSILGVNGESHPFIIEGLNVKGEVKKGQETVVTFTAPKKGIYRIICLSHPDTAHNGPMIGYIVVL